MNNINSMIEELENDLKESSERLNKLNKEKSEKQNELDLINNEIDFLTHPKKNISAINTLLKIKKKKAFKFGIMIFLFLTLGFSITDISLLLSGEFSLNDLLIAFSTSISASSISGYINYLEESELERKERNKIFLLAYSTDLPEYNNKLKAQANLSSDITLINKKIRKERVISHQIEEKLKYIRSISSELTQMFNPVSALEIINHQKKLDKK